MSESSASSVSLENVECKVTSSWKESMQAVKAKLEANAVRREAEFFAKFEVMFRECVEQERKEWLSIFEAFVKIDEDILPGQIESSEGIKIESNNYNFMDNDFDEEIIFSESDNHDCNQAIELTIAEQNILQEYTIVKLAPECGEEFFMSTEYKLFCTKLVVVANGTMYVLKLMSLLFFEKSVIDFSTSIKSGRRVWNPGIKDSKRILF